MKSGGFRKPFKFQGAQFTADSFHTNIYDDEKLISANSFNTLFKIRFLKILHHANKDNKNYED